MSNPAEILKPFGEFNTPGKQDAVANMLRDLAERADCGEIIGCAVATIEGNHEVGHYYQPGSGGWSRLIGSVAYLQYTMLKDWDK